MSKRSEALQIAMARYELIFKRSVIKDLRKTPKPQQRRILENVEQLAKESRPRGSEKLSGLERYRIRLGRYRILFDTEEQWLVVTEVNAGHRGSVYRQRYTGQCSIC